MAKAFTKYHYIAAGVGVFLLLITDILAHLENRQLRAQLDTAQQHLQIQQQIIEKHSQLVVDESELMCMAKNIFFEARGETDMGKLAVAHVTLNRVKSKRFPNTVCGVVHQAHYKTSWKTGQPTPIRNKCHFSWYCDGKSDDIEYVLPDGTVDNIAFNNWVTSFNIAKATLLGKTSDPTHGSTHYYNPHLADPYWKDNFEQVASYGNHVFLR